MATPLPVIANTFRCTLNWSQGSQTGKNVIHVRCPGGSATELEAFNAIDTSVVHDMWVVQVSNCGVDSIDVIALDGTSSTTNFTTGRPAKWTGVQPGEFTPAQANLVKFQTGVRGRDNRGRAFLPFVGENQTSAGSVVGATAAAGQTAWNTFLTNLNAVAAPSSWELVVAAYDRIHGGAGAHATTVVNAVFELELGTQRKRQERNR